VPGRTPSTGKPWNAASAETGVPRFKGEFFVIYAVLLLTLFFGAIKEVLAARKINE
jgi:hypothetical protein